MHGIFLIRLNHPEGDSLYASYVESQIKDTFDVLLSDRHIGVNSKIHIKTGTAKAPKINHWSKIPEDVLIGAEELIMQAQMNESSLHSKNLSQSVEDAMDLLVTAKDPKMSI